MAMVSHLHHLFDAATWQSDIHTLRWQDRPRQCPRCQRYTIGPWGTYHDQPGLRRDRCTENACTRPCNALTGTLLDGSKRALMHWILATLLRCLSCASRRSARELGVHGGTGSRWWGWLRQAALSSEIGRPWDGPGEADALYHTAGHKGQATQGGPKSLGRKPRGRRKPREPGRGHDAKARPALIAWVSPPGGRRHPSDQSLHGADGAEGRRPRHASRQDALHGLGPQLPVEHGRGA